MVALYLGKTQFIKTNKKQSFSTRYKDTNDTMRFL